MTAPGRGWTEDGDDEGEGALRVVDAAGERAQAGGAVGGEVKATPPAHTLYISFLILHKFHSLAILHTKQTGEGSMTAPPVAT